MSVLQYITKFLQVRNIGYYLEHFNELRFYYIFYQILFYIISIVSIYYGIDILKKYDGIQSYYYQWGFIYVVYLFMYICFSIIKDMFIPNTNVKQYIYILVILNIIFSIEFLIYGIIAFIYDTHMNDKKLKIYILTLFYWNICGIIFYIIDGILVIYDYHKQSLHKILLEKYENGYIEIN